MVFGFAPCRERCVPTELVDFRSKSFSLFPVPASFPSSFKPDLNLREASMFAVRLWAPSVCCLGEGDNRDSSGEGLSSSPKPSAPSVPQSVCFPGSKWP